MSEENEPTATESERPADSQAVSEPQAAPTPAPAAAPMGAAASTIAADGQPAMVPRLGFADNVSEALKHTKKSIDAQGSAGRPSDKLSAWLVPITSVALAAAVFCAGWARMGISIICLAALLYFILSRIGIMRTLSERQASLVWHLLLGTFQMGIMFTVVYLEILDHLR